MHCLLFENNTRKVIVMIRLFHYGCCFRINIIDNILIYFKLKNFN